MNNKEIMDYAEEAIIHTYNRFPVVLDPNRIKLYVLTSTYATRLS